MRAVRWLAGFLKDPVSGDPSMARLCALACVLIAAYAVYKTQPATTIAALIGGGAVALLSRSKAE
jgi:hypothetical protein